MGGREFFGQLEHVVMLAADDPITAHLGRVRRREAHRNGVVVHVQANEQDGAFGGRSQSPQADAGGRRGGGFEAGRPA